MAGTFDRKNNNGTARCVECGTLRQKANGEYAGGTFHCNPCYERAGDENSVADGWMTEADFVAKYGQPSGY
jgi:hypothetical protein